MITVDSQDGRGSTFTVFLPVMPRIELPGQGSHQMLQPTLTTSQDKGV
jgi:hypothetical protein